MKSKRNLIIAAVVLAVILIGAAIGYKALSGRVSAAVPVPGSDRPEAGETVEFRPAEGGDPAKTENVSAAAETKETQAEAEPSEEGNTVEAEAASGEETAEETLPEQELPVAADFTVETIEGIPVTLSDLIGKEPIIVNFWASWCPPCRGELPYFQSAYEKYGSSIRFMMIDLMDGMRETETTLQSFIQENGFTFPLYADRDGSASNAYEVYSIPVTLAITADGRLYYERIGALAEGELERVIESMMAE